MCLTKLSFKENPLRHIKIKNQKYVNCYVFFFFLVFDYSGIQAVSYIVKMETKMIKDQP